MKRLYGMVGPTASGKTALAIELSVRLGGEIISADSMQVYQGMRILSAQPTQQELERAPHHLVSFVSPGVHFDAAKYRDAADTAICDIAGRGKLPLLCGGTGLYVDALTKGIQMSEEADPETRQRLKEIASQPEGEKKLHQMLSEVDPQSAEKYPPGDVRRVIRSLEIFYATGKPRGESEKEDRLRPNRYDARLFALKWDRERLYERIHQRVDAMIKEGLIEEVELLTRADESVQETAAQAIGFKEIKQALEGRISMAEAIDLVKLNTRHLAKRQETWFRRDERVTWIDMEGNTPEGALNEISDKIGEEENRNEG